MPKFNSLVPLGREVRLDVDGPVRALALTADGGVAALTLAGPLGGSTTLQVERFGPLGRQVGAAQTLGSVDGGAGVGDAALVSLLGGGFAATWQRAFSHSLDPFFGVLDGSGNLVAGGSAGGSGYSPSAAPIALAGGGYALAVAAGDLFGQHAAITFTGPGGTQTLAAQDSPTGGLYYNDLQGLQADGGVGLFWTDRDGVHVGFLSGAGFTARLLDAGPADDLDLAQLADGRIVATWADSADGGVTVQAAAFDLSDFAGGAAANLLSVGGSGEFFADVDPEVVALRGGGFAISWHDGDADGRTLARTFGPGGEASGVFHAFGDFLGVDGAGRVVTTRIDDAGQLWLGREQVISAPVWMPGLDRMLGRLGLNEGPDAHDWM